MEKTLGPGVLYRTIERGSKKSGCMSDRFRVAILVSGSGTNMENLIQAAENGELPRAAITLVLSQSQERGRYRAGTAHGITLGSFNPRL